MNWKDDFWDYGGPGHILIILTMLISAVTFVTVSQVYYHGWDSLFHGGW